ncbi:Glycosyl-hydrolase 97 C-terminal, oligomerisation [Zunongwangia mangrovi]|uniref:Glycosyl-hydrolase 97 C-terminal, oligomerisation n=2 Tax=Zunongwangia mangrovi TaxID=1334022 RepID=A0A1I1LB23_9FLAO|nr:Glycosyl-hydrolase 97 C-terminal, oligomerisation [Zunongwangia mangrovi]
MLKKIFFILITALFCFHHMLAQESVVKSPDNKTSVRVFMKSGALKYTVFRSNKIFLEESSLGVMTSIGDFTSKLKWDTSKEEVFIKNYHFNKGKASEIKVKANQLTVDVLNNNKDTLRYTFRVGDNDIAFRYSIHTSSRKTRISITDEITSFNLPDISTTYLTPQSLPMIGWEQTKPSYEEEYKLDAKLTEPSMYERGYTFPALFKIGDFGWLLLSETGVDSNYPGSRLSDSDANGIYQLEFPQSEENSGIGNSNAFGSIPFYAPWRTISLGETLKPIVESTVAFDHVDPKYEPGADYELGRATWSWIVWQDGSINYEDQIKYIDLAASLDFEYVLIDNWWDTAIGKEKIKELVAYASSKDVKILLWYNSNGYWNDAPQTPQDLMHEAPARQKEMQWMKDVGVKGIKVDFFGGDKQVTMKLYEDILTDANNYGLTVTFHGCTLPRGWERMYPNYITSEAVKASEMLIFDQNYADNYARNATIFPFIRNTVGAMDFGPVFFKERYHRDYNQGNIRKTSNAFEAATAVLFVSPVQHFGITPEILDSQPKFIIDFIRKVPTVWDETKYISGEPGDHVAIARRKNQRWYVGVANGQNGPMNLKLDIPMLAGKKVALIVDNENGTAALKIRNVNKKGVLDVSMIKGGGCVIYSL